MSDALKAYQFIIENVPSWIDILAELEVKIKEREGHVSRVTVPARSLKKSGSNESIRPISTGKDLKVEILSAPQDGDMANPRHDQHLSPSPRKRKTTSIASTDSVPAKFRTRSMIIVYYDSEIQKTFEQVVRHIGTARNQLRRARTTLQMNALINGRDMTSPYDPARPNGPSSASFLPPFRSTRSPLLSRASESSSSSSTNTSLTATDAALEKAQSLCERGAHQFLREGDCQAEISGARESFNEAKRISESETQSLEQEVDNSIADESGGARKQRLGPHLQGFLQNSELEIDSDGDDGDEVDDPMMKLAQYQTTKTRPPLSVPA